MPPTASTAQLRTALQDRFATWMDELETLLADARASGREELSERLNQASRRLRQADGFGELAVTLADAATAFCNGAAVLRVAEGRAMGERIRGVDAELTERFQSLVVDLNEAAALAGVVSSGDPVVAISKASEVSAGLIEIAGVGDFARVSIFPIATADAVEGLLYCWGDVQSASLELLAQVAGLCLPRPEPAPAPVPEPPPALVTIASAPEPEPPPAPAPAAAAREWEHLPIEEQRMHLSAQRFARVRVAELRLLDAEAVHAGRLHRDVYSVLQDAIDKIRENFRRIYLAPCPSMVDYVHLELVRTLAHDNARLLGESYPGPLV